MPRASGGMRPAAGRAGAVGASGTQLAAGTAARRGGSRRLRVLLDLTHDLGVPVVASISLEAERGLPAMGLGAALDVARAAEKAFFELVQAELNLSGLARWARTAGPGPRARRS